MEARWMLVTVHLVGATWLVAPAAARADEPPPAETGEAAGAEDGEQDGRNDSPADPRPSLTVPAVAVGGQAVLLAPVLSGASLVVEYDLGPVHFDGTVGLVLAEGMPNTLRSTLRVFFPVHSGPLADFSLGGGIGAGYVDDDAGDPDLVLSAQLGGKIRSFIGKNIALLAVLGVSGLLLEDRNIITVGARAFGTAGFVYFFR